MSPIVLPSRIHRVVVHARGAIVTRSVALSSSLPEEACEIVLQGITPRAEPSTFRAIARGSREVVSVVARFVIPGGPAKLGTATERVETLEAERTALREERAHVVGRRNQLAGLTFDLGMDRRYRQTNPRSRIDDALAMVRLVQDELAAIDQRIAKIDENLQNVDRELEAAVVARAQARSEEREGASRPTLSCVVRFAPGQTTIDTLEVEYVVYAARFWPTYKAWLTKSATHARIELDALVVQDSGEDWNDVELSLSTADLVHDARLPELSSLRFGRHTPTVKRGYRPPPAGLDDMFEAYDVAMRAIEPQAASEVESRKLEDAPTPPPLPPAPAPDWAGSAFGPPATMQAQAASGAAAPMSVTAELEEQSELMPLRAKSRGLFAFGRAGAAPHSKKAARSALRPSAHAPAAVQGMAPGGGFFELGAPTLTSLEEAEDKFFDDGEFVPPMFVEPDDAWLDFDALMLPDVQDKQRRGRLTKVPEERARIDAQTAKRRIEGMSDPGRTRDPLATRGRFDHRYDAEGRGDIPSNGRPQRVHVRASEGPAKARFRSVPRESTDVYREAIVENPFGAPLCTGPIDIFLDGALVATTDLAAVDRGGAFVLGLGVEDRLRIARNARVEESSVGLLGGTTHVDHHVTVDVTSSLGIAVGIDVLECIPVTDDKDVSIKLMSAEPEAEAYDQSDIGEPVRGGRRFRVDVAAGGKASMAFAYRIKLPAKSEIVGGNRRE